MNRCSNGIIFIAKEHCYNKEITLQQVSLLFVLHQDVSEVNKYINFYRKKVITILLTLINDCLIKDVSIK